MSYPSFFYPKNSVNLFGLGKDFNFLYTLYEQNNLPKVLLLTGTKGIGKSTLLNHFLISVFDKNNYNIDENIISNKSSIHNQFKNNIFSNIIHMKGADFSSVKIDDIRNLKTKIFQSSIINKDRFIILDDVELFNNNSINALLKIIEEPSKGNYFFLINNNTKKMLETIKSRSLEIKINLSETNRLQITNELINYFKIEKYLDPHKIKLSPGNYLKFNYLCKENDILINKDLISNLSSLLNLYKKKKDIVYMSIAFFLVDNYFKTLSDNKHLNREKISFKRNFVFKNLNNYLTYNINQNSLFNVISNEINND